MGSPAINLFIGRIVHLLENEASFLGGLCDEVNEIKRELLTMGSFLMDAEKKKGTLTEVEKTWVAQVRDIVYDVEDVIDEFAYHINSQQVGGQFPSFLHKTIFLPKNLCVRHQIATKLQKINKTIKAIPERRQRYGVERGEETNSSSQNDQNWLRNIGESSLVPREDDLVGMEDEKKLLMGWLMEGDAHLAIVSIVGMGGSGKTTLAAKTCTDDSVKRHFECYASIMVSQTYLIDDLLRRLIKEFCGGAKEKFPPNLNDMVYKDLLNYLVNFLKNRRYLVLLDDVWDTKLLFRLMVVFQDSHKKSRILITTRNEDIVSFSFGVQSYCHRIQPLSEKESWSLFSLKAFSNDYAKSCPLEIELLGRQLVSRCQGLPLAIVALGGLMSSKTSTDEWSNVLENLNWQLSNNPMLEGVTKRILLLSLNDLPYQLKNCFLYCSIFPEDYSMKRKRLIRLWLAEGFVEQVNRVRPEDVADSYLSELISRSMLQVVSRNRIGKPRRCKMHDLMHELALSMSERENFFVIYDSKPSFTIHKSRRLTMQTIDESLKSFEGMSQLRSLIFVAKGLATQSFWDILPSGLKLLRVLDLEDMPIDKLPRELPYLFNLRYLNLRGTPIKELPRCIGGLHNLETLDIVNTKIEKLPSEIAKCKSLRHLAMYRYTGKDSDFKYLNGTRAPSNICNLKRLEIMIFIEAEGHIIKQLGNMTQLTKFGITNVREEDEISLCNSIQKLKMLLHLGVMVNDEEKFLKIEALSFPPPKLQKLILAGKLEKVPHWFHSLRNLTLLYLHWSRLTEDLLPHIEALPCLAELQLLNAYVGKELRFVRGFVKLKSLLLRNFPQTTEIVIEKGVMPNLQVLRIFNLMELKALPRGIEYLTSLKQMNLLDVSEELVARIRGEGAVDRSKVKHISEINHYYQTTNGKFHEFLS